MIERRLERHHLTPILRDRARTLHVEREAAEGKLWYFLCNRRMNGFRFRENRQVGPVHADFYCFQARLIVRLEREDLTGAQREWLQETAHAVIAVGVAQVNGGMVGVLETILQMCCERYKAQSTATKN